jgi:hypothetical protein
MKSRLRCVFSSLFFLGIFAGIAVGCQKTISETENTALVNRCQQVAEEFVDELTRFKKVYQIQQVRLVDFPRLMSRMKTARQKANRARKQLTAAVKNIPTDTLMTRIQADQLNEALDRVKEARQALEAALSEARRTLARKPNGGDKGRKK